MLGLQVCATMPSQTVSSHYSLFYNVILVTFSLKDSLRSEFLSLHRVICVFPSFMHWAFFHRTFHSGRKTSGGKVAMPLQETWIAWNSHGWVQTTVKWKYISTSRVIYQTLLWTTRWSPLCELLPPNNLKTKFYWNTLNGESIFIHVVNVKSSFNKGYALPSIWGIT